MRIGMPGSYQSVRPMAPMGGSHYPYEGTHIDRKLSVALAFCGIGLGLCIVALAWLVFA